MSKADLILLRDGLKKKIEHCEFLLVHAAWVSDGKGGHIKQQPILNRLQAQLEIVNFIISKTI
jgi:hypothetical protein